MKRLAFLFIIMLLGNVLVQPTCAIAGDDYRQQANVAIERGIEYLRSTQNDDGSWSPEPGPAITAMIVAVMLDQNDITANDTAVVKGV